MLHQKDNPIQEYKTSTEEGEYQYLYKKDDELKVILLQMQTKALLTMVTIL